VIKNGHFAHFILDTCSSHCSCKNSCFLFTFLTPIGIFFFGFYHQNLSLPMSPSFVAISCLFLLFSLFTFFSKFFQFVFLQWILILLILWLLTLSKIIPKCKHVYFFFLYFISLHSKTWFMEKLWKWVTVYNNLYTILNWKQLKICVYPVRFLNYRAVTLLNLLLLHWIIVLLNDKVKDQVQLLRWVKKIWLQVVIFLILN